MTDKATPSPASYDSVMVLYREVVEALLYNSDAVTDAETEFLAEVQRLAAQAVDRETGSIVDALKQDVELDKQQTGRLVLEASTGIHGEVSEILAKEWAKLAERLAAQAAPAETSAVVSAPKFTRLKFFRDLSNDERMRMLRVFMDLSTIPDDAIKTHGVQRQLFDRVFAVAQSAQAPAQAVQEARCACNDRPASECPGEWEPGCDLGNNPKYVRAYVDADRASSGATNQAVRMLTPEEVADCLPDTVKLITNEGVDVGVLLTAQELKTFGENYKAAGRTIPPSGEIGGV